MYFEQATNMLRLLVDVQLLKDRISDVNGAGDIGAYLLKLVNDKAVLRAPSPVTVPQSADTSSAATNGAESLENPKSAKKEPEKGSGSLEKEDTPPVEAATKPARQSSEKS